MKLAVDSVLAVIAIVAVVSAIGNALRNASTPGRPESFAQVKVGGPAGTVAGRIFDLKTGEPLIGACVTETRTKLGAAADIAGRYLIAEVPPGRRELRAGTMGYNDCVATVVLDSTTGCEVDFYLTQATIDLEGIMEVR